MNTNFFKETYKTLLDFKTSKVLLNIEDVLNFNLGKKQCESAFIKSKNDFYEIPILDFFINTNLLKLTTKKRIVKFVRKNQYKNTI